MGTKILKAAAVMIGMMAASVLLMTYINTNEHLVKLFAQQETYSLQEIQKEAEHFRYESNILDFSNMQVYIPDVESVWQVMFRVDLYDSDETASCLFEMGKRTGMMEFRKAHTDGSGYMSGYNGIDLGTLEATYLIPEDNVSGVVYPLQDGELSIEDAVAFVESHIKTDYDFVGSRLLDYQVYQVDVRKLAEDICYYQFKIKACYRGITLNKDTAVYEELDGVLERGFSDSHLAAMYDTDSLGYIRACCHSYHKLISESEVTSMISIRDACNVVENKLEAQKGLRVDSVELVYHTAYEYASRADKESGIVDAVKCVPVYHFTVCCPASKENHTMYFDVDVQTGITMESHD